MGNLDEIVEIIINRTNTLFSTRNAIMIGKYNFSQYLARRLDKDGLGFRPICHWEFSSTDIESYISSKIPENRKEFLVYCHELGHCKTKQPVIGENNSGAYFNGTFSNNRLLSEYNAWVWALRYFRRLGFSLAKEEIYVIIWSLEGYLKAAQDKVFAAELAYRFKNKFNIECKLPELPKPKIKPIIKKSKSWKPWHDLRQKEVIRQWKYN